LRFDQDLVTGSGKLIHTYRDHADPVFVRLGFARDSNDHDLSSPSRLNCPFNREKMASSMKPVLNIAGARTCHNRVIGSRGFHSSPFVLMAIILLSGTWLSSAAGCTTFERRTREVPMWELAQAEPVVPLVVGRSRIDSVDSLPGHLTQRLCPEFTLVVVARRSDWRAVRDRFGFEQLPPEADLSKGVILGLVAEVGEAADGGWPIALERVRTVEGQGSVEAGFMGGIYYPVRTAGYLELAYVPGLRRVRTIRVGHRSFVIRASGE
jgi:hypothetical protein